MDIQAKNSTKKKQPINLLNFSIGFFVIYFIVIMVIPYYLYNNAPFSFFLTYFANVDIVSNILTITFPEYFSHIYNINPDTIFEYISYNIISIVSLSGIFIYGINEKNKKKRSDLRILASMIVMSIITWTLPTNGIPYITNKITDLFKNTPLYNTDSKFYNIIISSGVSIMFILLEGIIIHTFISRTK